MSDITAHGWTEHPKSADGLYGDISYDGHKLWHWVSEQPGMVPDFLTYEGWEGLVACVRDAARVPYIRQALALIDQHGCEHFISGRCLDPDSGKQRESIYGADRWCDPCIARHALDLLAVPPAGDPDKAET